MKITIRVIGRYKDIAGKEELTLDLTTGNTLKDVVDTFVKLYPTTEKDKNRMMVIKNKMYASYDITINEGDEVTLLPPVVSGG
jgi:molybdopterin converting factor small subunit